MLKNLVLAKYKIVIADYKTVKYKFIKQGIDPDSVNKYIDTFKKLRDQNKIKDVKKKDIDFWGKGKFDDFVSFIEQSQKEKSKSEQKKEERKAPWKMDETPEGAKKVAENKDWVVYRIDNFEASSKIGTRNWCISRGENAWVDVTSGKTFYFFLSKNKSYVEVSRSDQGQIKYEDPWHRFAMQVNPNESKVYWNAEDKSFSQPETTNLPEFEVEIPKTPLSNALQELNTSGFTDEAKRNLEEWGLNVKAYDHTEKFLILEEYSDINDFVKYHEKETGLKWVLNALDDYSLADNLFYQSFTHSNSKPDIKGLLDALQKEKPDIYEKTVSKLIDQKFMDWLFETENASGTKEEILKWKRINKHFAVYISETDSDLETVFDRAYSDAIVAETETYLWKRIDTLFNDCECLRFKNLHETIYVGVHLDVLQRIEEEGEDYNVRDLENMIEESLNKLKIKEYDYEYPSDADTVPFLIEQLHNEWL